MEIPFFSAPVSPGSSKMVKLDPQGGSWIIYGLSLKTDSRLTPSLQMNMVNIGDQDVWTSMADGPFLGDQSRFYKSQLVNLSWTSSDTEDDLGKVESSLFLS